MLGMPLADSDGPTKPHSPRAGLSGRKPGASDEPEDTSTRTARGIAPASFEGEDEPDKRYMDPPSETLSPAATWQLPPSQPARVVPAAEPAVPSWQAQVDRPNPYGTTGRQPVRPSMSAPASPPPPPPPRSSPYSASAPEEWRTAARSVADKARASGGPASNSAAPTAGRSFGSGAGARPSSGGKGPNQVPTLRLKLDADEVEGHEDQYGYSGVPKSRLPAVLLTSLILIVAAGGGAYWAEQHGGLSVWAARLHLTQDATPASADPATLGAQGEAVPGAPSSTNGDVAPGAPSGAHGEAVSAAPPSAHGEAVSAAPPTTDKPAAPPSAAANGAEPSAAPAAAKGGGPANDLSKLKAADPRAAAAVQDDNAKALAEPEMPTVADPAAKAPPDSKPASPPKAAVAERPAPPKAAAHHAAASHPITHHEPVLKIRDLGASDAPSPPPEPSDTPYARTPRDEPPAPDEPR
jgi:hypothetical protein